MAKQDFRSMSLVSGLGSWLLLTATTVQNVNGFSIRPSLVGRRVSTVTSSSTTQLYYAAQVQTAAQESLNGLTEMAHRQETFVGASTQMLDGLANQLAEISGVPVDSLDSDVAMHPSKWFYLEPETIDTTPSDELLENSVFFVDEDKTFMASSSSPSVVEGSSVDIPVGNGNPLYDTLVSSPSESVTSDAVPSASELVASTTGTDLPTEQVAGQVGDNLMTQLDIDVPTVEPSSLFDTNIVDLDAPFKAGGIDMQDLFASITDKTNDLATAAKASFVDAGSSGVTQSMFNQATSTISSSVGKVEAALDSEKTKLVEQGSAAVQAVSDERLADLVHNVGSGMSAIANFLLLVVNSFLEVVSGHTLTEYGNMATSELNEFWNYAMTTFDTTITNFSHQTIADVATNVAYFIVYVVQVSFTITTNIVRGVTGKGVEEWTNEWMTSANDYINDESSKLLAKITAAVSNFGEQSLSELVALISSFLNTVGKIMVEGLTSVGGAIASSGTFTDFPSTNLAAVGDVATTIGDAVSTLSGSM